MGGTTNQTAGAESLCRTWVSAIESGLSQPHGDLTPYDPSQASPLSWATQVSAPSLIQAKAFAEALNLPFLEDLAGKTPSAEFVERIPIGFARQHELLGFVSEEGTIEVVFGSPRTWAQLNVLSRFLQRRIKPILASSEAILAGINRAYEQRTGQAHAAIQLLGNRAADDDSLHDAAREDLLDVSGRAPVIKLVNTILFDAVKARASDVHIQPYEDGLVVRMRVDGVLYDIHNLPKEIQDEVVSRIKVMGRMNIAEKRLPQDGRATVEVGDRLIDLRIASVPVSYGERIVLRLLDKSIRVYTLEELGMEPVTMSQFRQLIGVDHGLILVTGPTGSGKSTTLYAALQEINAKDRNIMTLEDPIEYQLEGISQTQVSDKKGMTFASGLRSVLRQDPDIIMVGEIRDRETAVMAIQSSLTGHLVFSTLHTNDAASTITRLLDLGIEQYLVASSLIAVLAQRLVRRVCAECVESIPVNQADARRLGFASDDFPDGHVVRGAGCENCRQTGYHGRLGIFEMLVIDDAIRQQIQHHANAAQIRDVGLKAGMKLLRDDGLMKIRRGLTTIEDVLRVTMRSGL